MTFDMTRGSSLKLVYGFALPMLVGNIFQQMYNFADTAIVGKFVGDSALASVGSTAGVVSILFCWIMGFTNGAGIIISQCLGARKYGELKKTVTAIIYIICVLSLLITVLGYFLSRPMLSILAIPENLMDGSVLYIRILFLFMGAAVVYNASGSILRSLGDSRTPLIALIISTFLNIGLDLLFIAKFGWGIAGAAVATGIAEAASAVFNIAVLFKNRRALYLESIPIKPKAVHIFKIIKTGLPAALESSLLSLGTLSVQRLINSLGEQTIAAYTAATKIDSIAISPIISVGSSLSVFSAQNVGARKTDRIRDGLYKTLFSLIGICIVIAAFIVIFRYRLLGIFLKDEVSIGIGAKYLTIVSIAYIIAAVMRTYLNVLRGAGDVNTSAVAGMSELGARIVLAYILVIPLGATGIFIATPLSWFCGATIPVIRYYSGKWKTKRLI